jgi:HWE histidine kinase
MSAQAHGWSEPRRRGFQLDLLTALFAAIGAMVLVAIAALWVIAPRFFSFDPPEQVNLVLYAIAFVAILCAAEAYGRLVRCLRAAEERHQFLMEELTHRVRNLVAISHSIVRQALPGQSDVAEKINWRLAALVTTNDLLAKSAEGGADLRDLITKEFAPYDATRLALRGEPGNRLWPDFSRADDERRQIWGAFATGRPDRHCLGDRRREVEYRLGGNRRTAGGAAYPPGIRDEVAGEQFQITQSSGRGRLPANRFHLQHFAPAF